MSYMPELSKLTPTVEKLWTTVDNLCFSVGGGGVLSFSSSVSEARVKLVGVLHRPAHKCREGK